MSALRFNSRAPFSRICSSYFIGHASLSWGWTFARSGTGPVKHLRAWTMIWDMSRAKKKVIKHLVSADRFSREEIAEIRQWLQAIPLFLQLGERDTRRVDPDTVVHRLACDILARKEQPLK